MFKSILGQNLPLLVSFPMVFSVYPLLGIRLSSSRKGDCLRMSIDLNGAVLEHNSLLFGISMHEPAELMK
jgi:hypothetical protein